jgi:hypothetical protein
MSQSESQFVLSQCTRHLTDNCKEACKGTMNEDHKRQIIELAKSLNDQVYHNRMDALRKINNNWAEYLDKRKHKFVATTFLDRGIQRWGKVTSNGNETINGVFGEAISLPLVYLIEHILQYQRDKYQERHDLGCKWSNKGKRATEYYRLKVFELSETASKRRVVTMVHVVKLLANWPHPWHRWQPSINPVPPLVVRLTRDG